MLRAGFDTRRTPKPNGKGLGIAGAFLTSVQRHGLTGLDPTQEAFLTKAALKSLPADLSNRHSLMCRLNSVGRS